MMTRCKDGHETTAPDFCDQCGMPVEEVALPVAVLESTTCPNCKTISQLNALFCESCGYDYTTGALPQQDLRAELGLPPVKSEPMADTESASDPPAIEDSTSADEDPDLPANENVDPGTAEVDAIPKPRPKKIAWVAEVWVDPQWHTSQESTDPLPPQGPPRIIPLTDRALIGRTSVSRNIHPDIDCELDSGCSRRQAYLSYALGHWYINDLESANGTFVASATASLPETAITGRTQVDSDTRIYIGSYTRIVVRPAIEGECDQTAGPS